VWIVVWHGMMAADASHARPTPQACHLRSMAMTNRRHFLAELQQIRFFERHENSPQQYFVRQGLSKT
jgi:hypothetical protein